MIGINSNGDIEKGSDYHIRSSLHKFGVSLNICESATIKNGKIFVDGKLSYKYKIVDNSYYPIFKKVVNNRFNIKSIIKTITSRLKLKLNNFKHI